MRNHCFVSIAGCLAAAVLLGLAGCRQAPPDAGWSGYAEGEYVYLSPGIAGNLKSLAVRRGDLVTPQRELFTLDDEAELAARDEAGARLSSAQASASNTEKGRRAQEIDVTRAQLDQARTQQRLATADLARQSQLLDRGFVARARVDDARLVLAQASARVNELQAALAVARLPSRIDEQAAARAQADAAREVLRQNQWRDEQKRRSAPVAGRIADLYFRVGEWVPAGQPVLSLLPPENIKARFFVPEGELGAIHVGDAVTLACDSCGTPIAATVTFISTQAEYTPPVIYSNQQRAKLVFLVEARPDPRDAERLKPGQPLDVRRAAAAPAAR